MTQYQPQYPGPAPGAQTTNRRRFPFVAGYFAWFSPAVWRDAGRRWRGVGFFYLLLLLAVTWAVEFTRIVPAFAAFVRDEVPKISRQVPPITIANGVATADVEQPHVITAPDSGEVLAVIDTTGATTEPPTDPSILLTKDALIVRRQGVTRTHDLAQVQGFQIDGQGVQRLFENLRAALWPVGYPVAVLASLIARLVQVLIYAAIGLAVASSVRPPLGYAACMRLAALAITPVILLDTLFFMLGVDPGILWTLLGIALGIGLLVAMVRANDDPAAHAPFGGGGGHYAPPGVAPAGYGGYPPPGYALPPTQPQQGYGYPGYPASGGYPPPAPPAPPPPPSSAPPQSGHV